MPPRPLSQSKIDRPERLNIPGQSSRRAVRIEIKLVELCHTPPERIRWKVFLEVMFSVAFLEELQGILVDR
jgi:hypothetical protein